MEFLLIHGLNALLYSSVLFLIAGGLSLIYGVMRIINLAHGNLYAIGAFVAAWTIGVRCMQKALLLALLEPIEQLRQLEVAGDFTARLAMLVSRTNTMLSIPMLYCMVMAKSSY